MTYADSSSQYQMSSKELAVQISIWPTAELFILDLKHNISNPSFKKEPCITQYMVTSIHNFSILSSLFYFYGRNTTSVIMRICSTNNLILKFLFNTLLTQE